MSKLGIPFIKKVQRNRFPVLLIDRVESFEPGVSAKAIKAFSYNEPFFQGHFDDEPVVPGFILQESMIQTLLIAFLTIEGNEGKKTAGIKYGPTYFKRKVEPGDVLTISAQVQSVRFGVLNGEVHGHVLGELACSTQLTIGIPDQVLTLQPGVGAN